MLEDEEFCRERGLSLIHNVVELFMGNSLICPKRIGENLVVMQHYDEDWVFMPDLVKEWVGMDPEPRLRLLGVGISDVVDAVVTMSVTRQLFRRAGFSKRRTTRIMRWYDATSADIILEHLYLEIIRESPVPLHEVVRNFSYTFLEKGPIRDFDFIPEDFGEITREE